MAKVIQIVERARRRLGVQGAEEPTAAHEAQQGLDTLSDMLNAWKLDGTITGFTAFDDGQDAISINATDNITLTDETNEALVACLAVRLCDDYGLPVPAAVASHCDIGKRAIAAKKFNDPDSPLAAEMDTGLLRMPSQRREYW